jgi:sortase (surface protein transpeptidase)
MAGRVPASLVAALVVLLGAALGGCTAGTGGDVRAGDTAAAPVESPLVASFRSSRTYEAVAAPVRLRIPQVRVDAALQQLGRAADGTVEVPSRPGAAGWYAQGPRPGQPGPAVILGHVDWTNRPAVFFRLTELRPGATVYVVRSDGSTAAFRVTGSSRVPKTRFPTDLVYSPTLEPALRLVTCGGSFDHATRNYRDNVIVYAVPA